MRYAGRGASCSISPSPQVQCVHATNDDSQQHYLSNWGACCTQTKLELVCEDEAADLLVDLIIRHGQHGA